MNEGEWEWSVIDHQKQLNITNVRAPVSGIPNDVMENLSFVGMLFILFPKSMVQTIIEESNKRLDEPMNMEEFLW